MQEMQFRSLGQEDSLEEGITTHASILAWRIQWKDEPGGLYSSWGHKELDLTERMNTHTHTFSRRKIMLLPTTSSSYVNIFYPGCWHLVNQPYLFVILLYQHVWFRFNFSFSGAFTSCCAQGMPDICSPKSQHPGDGLVSTANRVLPRWTWGQHEWCKDPGLWCGWSPGDSIKSFLGVVVVPVTAG